MSRINTSSNEGGDDMYLYGYRFKHEKGNVVLHAQSLSEAVQDLKEEE